MKLPKFLVGLLIGTAVGLIIWYWQKSTSAEEGALIVLDRLAAAEARVRELEGKLRLSAEQPYISDQPEVLTGLSDLWGLKQRSEGIPSEQDDMEEGRSSIAAQSDKSGDDLQKINGIGPVYERRLKEAGIHTFADLANQTPDELMEIAGLRSVQLADPERWITEAKSFSEA